MGHCTIISEYIFFLLKIQVIIETCNYLEICFIFQKWPIVLREKLKSCPEEENLTLELIKTVLK